MASFKVKLFIDNEERNVLNVDQSFRQVADITGKPEGKPYGEPLYLTLESTIQDEFFYHHTFSNASMVSGELVFYKRDGYTVLYKLEFANAHILGLVEEFDAYGSAPLNFSIKIGWGIIRINGIVFEESWNPDNPFEAGPEATVIEEAEPMFLDFFFEDEEGNEIDQHNLVPNQKVLLVVQTENADGDTIDLDLNNNQLDFKYNGQTATNDIITGIAITGDETRIELITIEEE